MRSRSFTLIEVLIAVTLGIVIVGTVAMMSIQVQKSISASTQREDVVRYARGVLDDIERSLVGLVARPSAPDPFSGPVLEIEAVVARTGADDEVYRDRLTLLTTVRLPDGNLGRGFVEYSVGNVRPAPNGSYDIGEVHRQLVEYVGAGDATPVDGDDPVVIADQVVGLRFDWLDADGDYNDPDAATSNGSAFSISATVDLSQDSDGAGTLAVPVNSSAEAILATIPIGGELNLVPADGSTTAPVRALIRRRVGTSVLLSDTFPNADGMTIALFTPPKMLRVTLIVLFGRGADAQTTRFSRTMAVPQ